MGIDTPNTLPTKQYPCLRDITNSKNKPCLFSAGYPKLILTPFSANVLQIPPKDPGSASDMLFVLYERMNTSV